MPKAEMSIFDQVCNAQTWHKQNAKKISRLIESGDFLLDKGVRIGHPERYLAYLDRWHGYAEEAKTNGQINDSAHLLQACYLNPLRRLKDELKKQESNDQNNQ